MSTLCTGRSVGPFLAVMDIMDDHLAPKMSRTEIPESLDLVPHPTARDKCIAKIFLKEGLCIFTEPAFSTILLPSEKAQRCDNCFRLPSGNTRLQRCTGCGSYWYCDAQCVIRSLSILLSQLIDRL